jgi:DNA-binding response OmpR family regulator
MVGTPVRNRAAACDVLVVDDDVAVGDTIARYLRRHGIAARTAHSGTSALLALATDRPKVAVLDYELPDTTGVKLAAELKALLPELQTILMSGAVPDVERRTLEASGIKVFVNKPMPLEPLRRAIAGLLGR